MAERALWATTSVEKEQGQWSVWIEVAFGDGMVRKRIETYRSEQLAMLAASVISRVANVEMFGT